MEAVPDSGARTGHLLVVDDEPGVARVLSSYFARQGWQVRTCHSPLEALDALSESDVDVLLTDLSMPEMSGVELLRAIRDRGYTIPVLVITGYGTIDSAVEAMKLGAFDYLCKPFDLEKVRLSVQRAYLHRQLMEENEHLRQELQVRYQFGNLIGSSPKMQEVYALVERAARSRANVLLLGESGTGKELVARALHYNSSRSSKRFVAVSCAALPSELLESELFGHEKGAFTGANWQRMGRFELADGGTLFLDEIGDISLSVQAKLMRAVQEREIDRVGGSRPVKVDVRLISATNRDLQEAIGTGAFREDLYYRLKVIEIRLPPLRERKEDIPLLTHHFLEKFAKRDGRDVMEFTPDALAVLEAYDWPGNVRELENAIEHAVALADEQETRLNARCLPRHVRQDQEAAPAARNGEDPPGRRLSDVVAEAERALILATLEECGWDLGRAGESLGLSPTLMRHHLRKHHLSGDYRREAERGRAETAGS